MVRVLTFQGVQVVQELLTNGTYLADHNLVREQRDYHKDVEQLGGYQPIWCFAPEQGSFKQEQFLSGELFQTYRCEMSTDTLAGKIMLEVEVSEEELMLGLTHNAYPQANVFRKLNVEDLCAIYTISDCRHWYYLDVSLAKKFRDDIIFPKGIQCKKSKKDKVYSVQGGRCKLVFAELPPLTSLDKDFDTLELNKPYLVECTLLDGKPYGTVRIDTDGYEKNARWVNIKDYMIVPDSVEVIPNRSADDSIYDSYKDLTNLIMRNIKEF